MDKPRVQVTYSAPPLFLLSDNWLQIRDSLAAQFPLRDITWKPALRPFTRTIRQLDVSFVSFDDNRDNRSSYLNGSTTLLHRPLLNLFVFACDDVDTYRSTVKSQIQEWQSFVSQRKHQDWLIILVSRPDARDSSGTFRKVKGSLFNKLKSDFNADKRDHCFQIAWSPSSRDGSTDNWEECGSFIKTNLLRAFDDMISQREEEVKRSESQRQMPGWNFCGFFLAKEGLAASFDAMGLLDDALLLYDELEASLFQVLKERSLNWFGRLVDPDSLSDTSSIFSMAGKPYHDLIVSNSISVFDCRVYLLARQCDLLIRLTNLIELVRRVVYFLNSFPKTLAQAKGHLAQYFIQSWIFSASMEAVSLCNKLLPMQALPQRTIIHGAQAELLDLAVSQLDVIGAHKGFLPVGLPFIPHSGKLIGEETEKGSDFQRKLSNPRIIKAISSLEGFYEVYTEVGESAISIYEKAGRKRFSSKLRDKLLLLKRFPGGATIPTVSASECPKSKGIWPYIEAFTRVNSVFDLRSSATRKKNSKDGYLDDEFQLCTLAANDEDIASLIESMDCLDIDHLFSNVLEDASFIKDGLILEESPLFELRLLPKTIRHAEGRFGTLLDIEVSSRLSVRVDDIGIKFEGGHKMELTYFSEKFEVKKGKQIVTTHCPIISEGLHTCVSWAFYIGKLQFHYRVDELSDIPRGNVPIAGKATIIDVPRGRRSVELDIISPDQIYLDRSNILCFEIRTRSDAIRTADIKLASSSSIHFLFDSLKTDEHVTVKVEAKGSRAFLQNTEERLVIRFAVPYSGQAARLSIGASLKYWTFNEPEVSQTAHFIRTVDTSLPVQVRVQDVFQNETLFCVLSIFSSTPHLIRLASTELLTPESTAKCYRVVGTGTNKEQFVTDQVSATWIYKVERLSSTSVSRDLILRIKLRTMKEEIEDLVQQFGKQVQGESSEKLMDRRKASNIVVNALSQSDSWIREYQRTGKLQVPQLTDSEDTGARSFADQMIERLHNQESLPAMRWRSIEMPLEVPIMTVVTEASLTLKPNYERSSLSQSRYFAGQPLQATCSIKTTFCWGHPPLSICEMKYEVEENRNDWILSGKRRGTFRAEEGVIVQIHLTLIPIHHGDVVLPRIQVFPDVKSGNSVPPSSVCLQKTGVARVLVVPRISRTTFILDMDLQSGDSSE